MMPFYDGHVYPDGFVFMNDSYLAVEAQLGWQARNYDATGIVWYE